MDNLVLVEFIKILPSILQLLFIIVVFTIFYKPIKDEMIPRLKWFKLFGFEAAFLEEELNRIGVQQIKAMTEEDKAQVVRRAKIAAPVLHGSKILWVDYHPSYNLSEYRVLTALGIYLNIAHTSEEAMALLKKNTYHAIISDMIRDGNTEEGYPFVPTILYSSTLDTSKVLPEGVFAATNRIDHLVHYVIDIIERVKK